jgi:hypothetical protein
VTKITDMIWLGDSHDAMHADLKVDGITAILNVACDLEGKRGWSKGIEYAQCGLMDGPGNNMASYYAAVMMLASLVRAGKRTLVHCHKGQSRSPAVVIMYLHLEHRRGWDYWRKMIADLRPKMNEEGQFPHLEHRKAFDRMNWRLLSSVIGE